MKRDWFPDFQPHPLLRGGHAQTLAGVWLPWRRRGPDRALQHRIRLSDGDSLVLHDDRPPEWQPSQRVALLMHGLAGSYLSGYMIRVSHRLSERGIRTFRLDLRGAGAGAGLARRSYHAGCSPDVVEVLGFLQALCPGSAICLIGFSLSGNVVLKLLGESPDRVGGIVERAMAINPPIDLRRSAQELGRFSNRIYDRHFVKTLHARVQQRRRTVPDAVIPDSYRLPKGLYEFDDRYTAPVAGFESADEYYSRCSGSQYLQAITIPTWILTSADDPLVPAAAFGDLRLSEAVSLHITRGGGHLGYIAARNTDPDRRWMDWRIVDWVTAEDRIP